MNKFEELRKEKKITQESVAQILGVTPKTYRTWCKEEAYPDSGHLIKLRNLYQVSIDYLLGLSDYRKNEDETEKTLKTIDNCIEQLKLCKSDLS